MGATDATIRVDWVRKEKFDSTLKAGVFVPVGRVAPVPVAVARPEAPEAPVGKLIAAPELGAAPGKLGAAAGGD